MSATLRASWTRLVIGELLSFAPTGRRESPALTNRSRIGRRRRRARSVASFWLVCRQHRLRNRRVEMPKASRTGNPLDVSWQETVERLRRFVGARVGDAELAADITQDVLL